jgi:type II secretory pathway pseudopilin PulG
MPQFQVKAFSKTWATMLELMAMMAIMGLGIAAMLWVVGSGSNFAKDTEDNIKAINLAREWIEWVISWRNTNWLRFSSDRINCWKNIGYDSNCIGWGWSTQLTSGSYVLLTQNGLWYLSGVTTPDYASNWPLYSTVFQTWLDSDGFFTQTGVVTTSTCSTSITTNCLSKFTREIIVDVPVGNSGSISVRSQVRWKGKRDHSVEIETTLTNWKSKF